MLFEPWNVFALKPFWEYLKVLHYHNPNFSPRRSVFMTPVSCYLSQFHELAKACVFFLFPPTDKLSDCFLIVTLSIYKDKSWKLLFMIPAPVLE